VALAAGVGAAVGALTQTEAWGWADARTLALLAGGIALASFAVARSLKAPAPAVDVKLLAHRSFALATVAAVFAGAALFAWLLFGVLFLTGIWRYSIGQAGLAVTPGAVVAVFASILAGRWAQRGHGSRAVVLGGALMAATGIALAAGSDSSPAFVSVWLPCSLVSGFAFGLLMTGVATSAAAALPPERFAAGTGLNLTARQLGGALAVALAAALVAGSSGDPAYDRVWLLCAVAGAGAGVTGLALGAAQGRRA
jgi:predicted MFS family arabinose efflux permease